MSRTALVIILCIVVCSTKVVSRNVTINDRPEKSCAVANNQKWRSSHTQVLQTSDKTFFIFIDEDPELNAGRDEIIESFETSARRARIEPCAQELADEEQHRKSAYSKIEYFGFGRTFKLTQGNFCVREVDFTYREKGDRVNVSLAKDLFEAIDWFQESTVSVAKEVLTDYGVDWKDIYTGHKFNYTDPGHKFVSCELVKSVGVFSNQTWGLDVSVTNTTPSEIADFKEREYFTEFVTRDGSHNLRTQVCSEKFDVLNSTHGTGLSGVWSGSVGWSSMAGGHIEENPALGNARNYIDFAKEMVQDIDSKAATAILVIPAVLCFFPLTLFQDTSVWTIFIYMLVTDIISVMPILFRGLELYNYGRRTEYSMISWVYGNVFDNNPGAVETWVARCKLKDSVRIWGIVFIALAVCSMILGLSIELLAVLWLRNIKNSWDEKAKNEKPQETHGLLWYLRNLRRIRLGQSAKITIVD